jgi:hypothetical protein
MKESENFSLGFGRDVCSLRPVFIIGYGAEVQL